MAIERDTALKQLEGGQAPAEHGESKGPQALRGLGAHVAKNVSLQAGQAEWKSLASAHKSDPKTPADMTAHVAEREKPLEKTSDVRG